MKTTTTTAARSLCATLSIATIYRTRVNVPNGATDRPTTSPRLGHGCSSDYRAAEFKRRQQAMARQIFEGSRILIAWPRDTHDTEF